jgi:hypothetical protein
MEKIILPLDQQAAIATMSACTTTSGGERRSRVGGCSYEKSSKLSGW